MEDDIENHSPTVMFRRTPCNSPEISLNLFKLKISKVFFSGSKTFIKELSLCRVSNAVDFTCASYCEPLRASELISCNSVIIARNKRNSIPRNSANIELLLFSQL